jgi:DNA-directed RNA polymerase subunit RPC12/RpoP
MYKCLGCGRKINLELTTAAKIICPSCGYRILEKERPKTAKKVQSV